MTENGYSKALVTGATSGIGAALVRRLVAIGIEVHMVARDEGRLATIAASTGAVPHRIDLSDTASLKRLAEEIEPDVLCNNAGQSRPGSILDTDLTDIDLMLDVNLQSALYLVRLFAPGMARRNRGHIINISSVAGHHTFPKAHAAYSASKAGLHALTRQLRLDLHGHGVRVTEISPGRVKTEIFARQFSHSEGSDKRFYEGYEALEADDIASAALFALSAPARMDVTYMEVLPTNQVMGGMEFVRSS